MALPKIEINLDHRGMGTVLIDGHPLHHGSYKLSIESEIGKPARVIVEMWGEVSMTAPAEVTLDIHDPRIEHGLVDTTTADSGGFRRINKGRISDEEI